LSWANTIQFSIFTICGIPFWLFLIVKKWFWDRIVFDAIVIIVVSPKVKNKITDFRVGYYFGLFVIWRRLKVCFTWTWRKNINNNDEEITTSKNLLSQVWCGTFILFCDMVLPLTSVEMIIFVSIFFFSLSPSIFELKMISFDYFFLISLDFKIFQLISCICYTSE